jgi:diguanylate cyclase (GGDEF)-like protein
LRGGLDVAPAELDHSGIIAPTGSGLKAGPVRPIHGAMNPIATLVVADDDPGYARVRRCLEEIPQLGFRVERVDERAATRRLGELEHDLYLLLDSGGSALEVLRYARAAGCRAPIIVIADGTDGRVDTEVIRAGAADCLGAGELSAPLLQRAIMHAQERNRSEDRLLRLASYDHLTGIANRSLFRERLNRVLIHARRQHASAALLVVDIDRFHRINDSLGNSIGDAVLRETAAILRTCIGDETVLGRLGSDEFVALLEGDTSAKDAVSVAQQVLKAMRELEIEGRRIGATVSIGVTVFPSDGATVEELLRNADAALATAKGTGGDSYQCFDAGSSREALEQMSLERRLRRAVDDGLLELHYQPQVALPGGAVIGLEALLRWRDGEDGMISPARFVPILEETGLIVPVGEWVIRSACAQQVAWQTAGTGRLRVAVNVSPLQFRRDLFAAVSRALEATGADPTLLELEITEGLLIDDLDACRSVLTSLKELGVRIAIDDFGTGYSSLVYLRRLPIDVLKVDRSFVRDVERDPDAAAIVGGIIALAHKLGLEVIAEGVETVGQRRFLEEQGCEIGQGYLFSPPLPAIWQPEVPAGAIARGRASS